MRHVSLMMAAILASAMPAPLAAQQLAATEGQAGAADLCRELMAYADKAAADHAKQSEQAGTNSSAPPPRRDGEGSGTQGGGSVSSSSSNNTQGQSSQAPMTPAAPAAAPEAASSPHATDGGDRKASLQAKLPEIRQLAQDGDRSACRDTVQSLRRDGAELPAALIALGAYEPDPAKR